VADDSTAQGKDLAQERQLRIVFLLGVGSHACNSHLCKTGQAEVWVEVFDKLLPFFSNAGRKSWALKKYKFMFKA